MASPTIMDTISTPTTLAHSVNQSVSGTYTLMSYTVPSGGQNKMLIVSFLAGGVNNITDIKQNGVSFYTNVQYDGGGIVGTRMFWCPAPTTGNLDVVLSSDLIGQYCAFTLQDCAQTSAMDTHGIHTGINVNTTTVTTTVGNDFLIAASLAGGGSSDTIIAYGGGQAQIGLVGNVTANTTAGFSWKAAGSTSGSEDMSTEWTGDLNNDQQVLAFKYQAPSAVTSTVISNLLVMGTN